MNFRPGATAAIVLAALLLSACMPVVTDWLADRSAPPLPPAEIAAPATTPAPTPRSSSPAPGPTSCTDPSLSAFGGRVIAVGDSLGQGLAQILMNNWRAATFINLTTNSSGLARPDFFDTVGRFAQAAAAATPGDIAVIWLGANDNQSLTTASGGVAAYASNPAEWQAEYTARVAAVGNVCVANGLACYWLFPAASDADAGATYVSHRARMETIRNIIDGVARNPAYSRNVHIVDVWNVRDVYPGWDPAHPGMSGLTQAASLTTSAVAAGSGVCMR